MWVAVNVAGFAATVLAIAKLPSKLNTLISSGSDGASNIRCMGTSIVSWVYYYWVAVFRSPNLLVSNAADTNGQG
ncbi:MAG TPA: hypothetical protein DCM64_07460 [Gammaproteobacteria bacterium]|nr:hypothetical protein [Gammaproteobacteria bacterium]